MEGKTLPTEKAHAEFSLAFVLITAKGIKYYQKLSEEDKNKLVAVIIASGGAGLSIAGIIEVISVLGIVGGLSAAGITSGLAAVGAIIGGGMAAGIAIVSAIPVLIGGVLVL